MTLLDHMTHLHFHPDCEKCQEHRRRREEEERARVETSYNDDTLSTVGTVMAVESLMEGGTGADVITDTAVAVADPPAAGFDSETFSGGAFSGAGAEGVYDSAPVADTSSSDSPATEDAPTTDDAPSNDDTSSSYDSPTTDDTSSSYDSPPNDSGGSFDSSQ